MSVKIGAEVGGAVHVFLNCGAVGVEAIHLAAKGTKLFQCDVRGAALSRCSGAIGGGRKRGGALVGECSVEDVGCGVQVALGVAADELLILGKGNIAFDHAGTHTVCSLVALESMLGELKWRSTMREDEVRGLEFLL